MIKGEPYIEIMLIVGKPFSTKEVITVSYAVKPDWYYATSVELPQIIRVQEAWIRANNPDLYILGTKMVFKFG